jgi:hypothetical protein
MGSVVWKKALLALDVQEIEVPDGAEILTAREQLGQLCIWFRCDPNAKLVMRQIAICGTGHSSPSNGRYVGTGFMNGGDLVFHVFENSDLQS